MSFIILRTNIVNAVNTVLVNSSMLAAVLPHVQTTIITRTDKLTKLMVISVNFTLLWVFFRRLKLHLKLRIQVLHVFQTITHLKEIEVKSHQYHFKMSRK